MSRACAAVPPTGLFMLRYVGGDVSELATAGDTGHLHSTYCHMSGALRCVGGAGRGGAVAVALLGLREWAGRWAQRGAEPGGRARDGADAWIKGRPRPPSADAFPNNPTLCPCHSPCACSAQRCARTSATLQRHRVPALPLALPAAPRAYRLAGGGAAHDAAAAWQARSLPQPGPAGCGGVRGGWVGGGAMPFWYATMQTIQRAMQTLSLLLLQAWLSS